MVYKHHHCPFPELIPNWDFVSPQNILNWENVKNCLFKQYWEQISLCVFKPDLDMSGFIQDECFGLKIISVQENAQ